jgi:hypothetical protein
VRRDLLREDDARTMAQWAYGGGFRWTTRCASRPTTAAGAIGCCATRARPPFALERLREIDPERLVYDHPKPGPDTGAALILTRLELLGRIAALVPPPRVHRHRYFDLLAPHSP